MADIAKKGCPALSQDLAHIAFATEEILKNTDAVVKMQADIKAETEAVSQTVDKANQAVVEAQSAVDTATKAANDAQATIKDIDKKGYQTHEQVETTATDVSNQTYLENMGKERVILLAENGYSKDIPKMNEVVLVRPDGVTRSNGVGDFYIKIGDGVNTLDKLPCVTSPDGVKLGETYGVCEGFINA